MKKLITANSSIKFGAPSALFKAWDSGIQAKESDNTISILDVIDDYLGFSTQRMAAALRSIGDNDVVVQINSPGGDMYAGIAMYNMLKEHKGKVTVKVLGIAASAASIIAMAGDERELLTGAQIMIHNAWSIIVGNRNDLDAAKNYLRQADEQMAAIYAETTGIDKETILEMMDAETYLTASKSLELGFATATSDAKAQTQASDLASLRAIENALRAQGYSRSERLDLINEIKNNGKPSAAGVKDKPSAVDLSETAILAKQLQSLLK